MSGISTKLSSASMVADAGCGGLSIKMDMFSTRSSRPAATPRPPSDCWCGFWGSRAVRPASSPTSWNHIQPQSVRLCLTSSIARTRL